MQSFCILVNFEFCKTKAHVLSIPSNLLFVGSWMLDVAIARLACLRHAASIHPEPGSNSQKNSEKIRISKIYEVKNTSSVPHQNGEGSYHFSIHEKCLPR